MKYVWSLIFAAMFCFSDLDAAAASTVEFQEKTITGRTPITAQLSTETFSTRALENALHKLVVDSTHKIKSFSLVEDGQLLIDQIQSQTNIRIFEYQILNQRQNGDQYEIDVKFLYAHMEQAIAPNSCRKVPTQDIPTAISLNSKKNNLLPWASLRPDTIQENLLKLDFSSSIKVISAENNTQKQNELYRLKRSNISDDVYDMLIDVNYEPMVNRNILGKTSALKVSVNVQTNRYGSSILNNTYASDFIVDYKTLNNISVAKSRRNWKQTQNEIYSFLTKSVASHLQHLECINISPKINIVNKEISLDFGSAEGIGSNDLIVAKDKNGKDVFLKIKTLGQHSAALSPVSNLKDYASLRVSAVHVLSGI
ncbi:MAG: hypothetical protein EBX05_08920 [Rhodobacteraceae bacterium]|nr:hypothetical protein [Paracoccaceae bacterium]